MRLEDIDKHYNRCPFCEHYTTQPHIICDYCIWRDPIKRPFETDMFRPTERWNKLLLREVTE